ncbi:putative P450 monooxygenase, partial [Periconia macrospinosa]
MAFLTSPALLFVASTLVLYSLLIVFRRLVLSPIAQFPGPRLAALTFWYEFYYDVIRCGRYSWKIKELHQRYGPVVRINPYEIHVSDPAFYDSIYVGPSRRTDKFNFSARMFGTSLAAVGTTSHDLHRLRRSALNSFFSKRSISQLEPKIQRIVDYACHLLEERGSGSRKLSLKDCFAAFSADVIGEVAFGHGYGLLDRPDFEPGWQKLMMDLSRATHLMKQFPWAYAIFNSIPPFLVSLVHPLTKRLLDIRSQIDVEIEQTRAALKNHNSKTSTDPNTTAGVHPSTILHSVIASSDLPAPELATPRLVDECFTLLGAGTITTAHTLATIVYYVLSHPAIKSRLEAELSGLCSYLPDAPSRPGLKALEHAPYLSAIISEGLRLSFGVSHRLPRIAPDTALEYEGTCNGNVYNYVIPPGVPVSMTQMFIHLDPNIYAHPTSFDPNRWLESESMTDEEKEKLKRRKHYLVPFSKGTRMCAGMYLAYAELHLMMGALFGPGGVGRRMRLVGTSVEDVECAHDFFNPSPRLDSKGVRV